MIQLLSKSKITFFTMAFIAALLVFGCKKALSSGTFEITKIENGNTLVLDDEYRVRLIGIGETAKTKDQLAKYIGETVQIVFDKENRYPHNTRNPFPAYIRLSKSRLSLNGFLLKAEDAEFNSSDLHDSLSIFREYAGASPSPRIEPTTGENLPISEGGKVDIESVKPEGTKYTASEIFQNNINSVFAVCILTSSNQYAVIGSGFFIKGNIGITNFHVINGQQNLFIKTKDGSFEEVSSIIGYSKSLDYAFLKIATAKNHTPVKIANALPPVGEDVVLIGNPQGLEFSLSKGVVSGYRRFVLQDKDDYIQVDAAASPGNSGSPLFNAYGQVVGILTSGLQDCQNCNFCLWIGLVK